MESEQMMSWLLAEIRTGQEHMKANQAKMDGHIEADRVHMQQIMTKIETDQEEMIARMDANQERMNASLRENVLPSNNGGVSGQ
jgi:hypothetical protein